MLQVPHLSHAASSHRMVDCEAPVLGQADEELLCLIVEMAADWIQGGIKWLSPCMKIKLGMNQHNLWKKSY
jgi:hypothetical protein